MKHLGEFQQLMMLNPSLVHVFRNLLDFFCFTKVLFIYLFKVFDILLRGGKFAKPSELIFTNRGT